MAKNRSVRAQPFVEVLVVLVLCSATVGCSGLVSSAKPSQIPQSLKISTTVLPNGEVGQTYQNSLAATGGTPPYVWSVASGALPNGLAVNSASGIISGQPSAVGAFTFAVSVQDSSKAKTSAQSQMSVQITAASDPATLQI